MHDHEWRCHRCINLCTAQLSTFQMQPGRTRAAKTPERLRAESRKLARRTLVQEPDCANYNLIISTALLKYLSFQTRRPLSPPPCFWFFDSHSQYLLKKIRVTKNAEVGKTRHFFPLQNAKTAAKVRQTPQTTAKKMSPKKTSPVPKLCQVPLTQAFSWLVGIVCVAQRSPGN